MSEPAWLHRHVHEPNPAPPSAQSAFTATLPDGKRVSITVADLELLPLVELSNCHIVSTGHGTSGPFTFGGTRLSDLLQRILAADLHWDAVDVVSADGFGCRVLAGELRDGGERSILLSYLLDGQPMTRAQGLVRLIVPSEVDDALRQVKWVAELRVHADPSP